MQDIENVRSEIDQIHNELARLFKRRLQLTRKIWEIKKSNEMPMIDRKREDDIIHRFDEVSNDAEEKIALQNFFKNILTESRKYLEIKTK
jgi:chorismate mutase/prephenate dehydratase